jgi:TonB family protein
VRRASLLRALVAVVVVVAGGARAIADAPRFEAPKLLHFEPATLPPELAQRDADVVLDIDVDETGKPTKVAVVKSAGELDPANAAVSQPFDDAAVAAAQKFLFVPGRADGKPVPVRVTFRYRFAHEVPQPAPPATPTPPPRDEVPLSGVVLSRGERLPLAGVSVIVDDGPRALTDAAGKFEFPSLTPGAHVVHLRGAQINAADAKLELHRGKATRATYWVIPKERYSSLVRGRAVVQETIEETLSTDEIKHIPGTQGDTLKAVQNLPGVARPPFNGGLLVVWGSSPQDTRTYVDGVFIPTLYHFGGLRSTVNSDIISSLVFMPGGYSVEHGRGLGGAVELETRAPRSDGYHGFAQIDLIDVSALVEGPITKNLSFVAAARASWLKLFLPAFVTSSVQASPQYFDYQAELLWKASSRDDVTVLFFGSDDQLNLILKDPNPALTLGFDNHTYYHRGVIRWRHRFANGSSLSVIPSVGYDVPYGLQTDVGSAPFSNTNGMLEYNLRAFHRTSILPSLRVDAGLDYEGTRYTLDATQNPAGLLREGDTGGFSGYNAPDATQAVATDHLTLYTNSVAPFLLLDFAYFKRRLGISPQLRLETMSFLGYPGSSRQFSSAYFLPEPRLAVRWQVIPMLTLRASLGVYHQAPDSPDFSSVFGSTKLQTQFGIHYVLGGELNPTARLHIEMQGFYKDLSNLVVRGQSPSDPPLENTGIGRVYGAELLVRQELWHNFFGWVSYTLSRSERRDHPNSPWRLFEYDQTHILTLVASYKLPRGFQVGLRFRYATGNPYTPVNRSYFDINSYSYVPIYGAVYSARVPAFNQLDLRVDKTFLFNRWKLLLYLDVENVYDAQSAEGTTYNYNYRQSGVVAGLPLLPVLGVRGEF